VMIFLQSRHLPRTILARVAALCLQAQGCRPCADRPPHGRRARSLAEIERPPPPPCHSARCPQIAASRDRPAAPCAVRHSGSRFCLPGGGLARDQDASLHRDEIDLAEPHSPATDRSSASPGCAGICCKRPPVTMRLCRAGLAVVLFRRWSWLLVVRDPWRGQFSRFAAHPGLKSMSRCTPFGSAYLTNGSEASSLRQIVGSSNGLQLAVAKKS
jgi:hypothetical protein